MNEAEPKAKNPGQDLQSVPRAKSPAIDARKGFGGILLPPEFGGPTGPEPTRYGDWERNGRVSDF